MGIIFDSVIIEDKNRVNLYAIIISFIVRFVILNKLKWVYFLVVILSELYKIKLK